MEEPNEFSVDPPERDLAAGTQVGEYVVEDVIGRGGFGTVYRASQPVIGKRAAVKVLARKFSVDAEVVSRFAAEARAVNQIRHRHIIDIFAFGQLPDGRHYYVMELLEGEPLDRHCATHGPLAVADALPILRAIARALDAAHAKGIAHRDLKPENIFLARDSDGEVFPKLLDFGIAKLMGDEERTLHKTRTGVPIGTPFFMSPEQCRGRDVDHRTDLYSLGVLAYRLLTNTYPFDGDLVDILHRHLHEPPPPPSSRRPGLSPAADRAVLWLMQKDPADRPPSATAGIAALDEGAPTPQLASARPGARTVVDASSAPGPAASSRRRWLVSALAALAVVCAGVVAVVVLRDRRARDEATSRASAGAPGTAGASGASRGASTGAVPGSGASGAASGAPAGAASSAAGAAAGAPDATSRAADAVAGAASATARLVTVRITGAPAGTQVMLAGGIVGVTPTPVQLPHATNPVTLVFQADGFYPASLQVTPDHDQELRVRLRSRGARRPVPDPDDLADPFTK